MNMHCLRVSLIIVSSVLSHHAMDAASNTPAQTNMPAPANRTPKRIRQERAKLLLSMQAPTEGILDLTGEYVQRQTRSTKKQKTATQALLNSFQLQQCNKCSPRNLHSATKLRHSQFTMAV